MNPQDKGRRYERCLDEGETCIPLSGAGFLKEDKKDPEDLIQSKFTTHKSYTLKLEDLLKLERNAALESRSPRLDVGFELSMGKISEWVIVPKKVYRRLRGDST